MKQKIYQLITVMSLVLSLVAISALALNANAAPLNGRTNVEGQWGMAPGTITLAGTNTFTPTQSLYWLQPSTLLTMTLSTGGAVPGDTIFFVGKVATATVIVDTTATAGGGNRELGNGDVIGFFYDGAKWVESFFSDNS